MKHWLRGRVATIGVQCKFCLFPCLSLLLFSSLAFLAGELAAEEYARYSAPEMFTYKELVALSEDKEFEPALAEKLKHITTIPFLSNEAYYRGARPRQLEIEGLGPSLRVVFWNIERGIRLDEIKLLFTNKEGFVEKAVESHQKAEEEQEEEIAESTQPGVEQKQRKEKAKEAEEKLDLDQLKASIDILQSADVIILNEVDWGMPRSGYREVIVELGEALNMNWAFGVEFVEIDPVVLGTETFEGTEDEQEREELIQAIAVERDQLRALHGTAILSRYPIREARLQPFALHAYDWYGKEKGIRPTEKGIRAGLTLLGEKSDREMRRGGRTILMAQLDVPDLPEKRLTVVSPHLENRTKPKNRQKQIKEVLELVRKIRNPVIIAGDLNTTGGDSESFRLERRVQKKLTEPDFWVNQGVKYGTGVGLGYDVFKAGFKFSKNVSDPTVKSIPFFAPNKERNFFVILEEFRFEDGTAFDFRGNPERTINGTSGTLANSNQRAGKGFANTYDFVITVGVVGKFKLDWIFVKSYLENPRAKGGPYAFAPHFARTMQDVNFAFRGQLSDHNPMVVDLPFNEPSDLNAGQGTVATASH